MSVDILRLESARRAVLLRSKGHCENPRPDHPAQMIALCPNCHAIKTRGRTREQLRHELFTVARQRHETILSR